MSKPLRVIAVTFLMLAGLLASAGPASAKAPTIPSRINQAASALAWQAVYADPTSQAEFRPDDISSVAQAVRSSELPVKVAFMPAWTGTTPAKRQELANSLLEKLARAQPDWRGWVVTVVPGGAAQASNATPAHTGLFTRVHAEQGSTAALKDWLGALQDEQPWPHNRLAKRVMRAEQLAVQLAALIAIFGLLAAWWQRRRWRLAVLQQQASDSPVHSVEPEIDFSPGPPDPRRMHRQPAEVLCSHP